MADDFRSPEVNPLEGHYKYVKVSCAVPLHGCKLVRNTSLAKGLTGLLGLRS